MALTSGHHLFASLDEDAFNKFIKAYRASRPKYFFFACPPLGVGVPGTDFWVIPPLPIPGTSSGMPISVEILDAVLDFNPAQPGLHLPPPLALGPNQFAFTATVEVCFVCGFRIAVPNPDDHNQKNPNAPRREPGQKSIRPRRECLKLSIWAVGHPFSIPNSAGGRDIGLQIDGIAVKDVGALEPLIDCYTETMVNAILDALRFPVEQFALGGFITLSLADGPLIADNQLKVWAQIS
jgi:hypothetical protein